MDQNQTPQSPRTPPLAAPPPPPPPAPSGADRIREEYQAMETAPTPLTAAETILRHPGRILYELRHQRAGRTAGFLLLLSVLCLSAYGLTVGLFSGGQQLWVAPAKVTLGLLFSGLICLPSLVIFSCLSGSNSTIAEVTRLLTGVMALTSLLLIGFGPVSWIFSQSTESLGFMGFLHFGFWGIGTYYGLRFLFAATHFLDGQRVRHLVVWSFIFVLVCLQMTTTLRPILGTSENLLQSEKKFFLTHWGETMSERSVTTDANRMRTSRHE